MTTLAIIGSGIVGRSLLYALAREKKPFEKITLVYSDHFTSPCTMSSTAIVAPRGITSGVSPLGDLLKEGYETFATHVELDNPRGVYAVSQYSSATKNMDKFLSRYPDATKRKHFFKNETLMVEEKAYLVNPKEYTEWLMEEVNILLGEHLEVIHDLVVEVRDEERVHLKTLNGRNLGFDKVIFTGGTYNRFWKDLAPGSVLESSKPVQGSYLEFRNVEISHPSFSLTLDGDNLIWNKQDKILLIGSTTRDAVHLLPPEKELQAIYKRIQGAVEFSLPSISEAEIKVGLREKAKKREPYIIRNGHLFFFGGLYKNGFTLSLKMSRNLSHQYL